jgi:hypothetical protein
MSEVFQAMYENNCSPTILYPAKLSFKIDRAVKIFYDKQNMTTKPSLGKVLQGIMHKEDESKQNHKKMGNLHLHTIKSLNKQKPLNGRNHHIPININTKCQWTQLPIKRHHLEK